MILGLTMRMERKIYPDGNGELRDALACDWPHFMAHVLPELGYVFLPNLGASITSYAAGIGVQAIILTGGEDLGVFPKRDLTEKTLLAWAYNLDLPIIGICRGAQIINIFFGGCLQSCTGHVGTRHEVIMQKDFIQFGSRHNVNSYHDYCIPATGLADDLTPMAVTADGCVEGFIGANKKICGLMWHPEREDVPSQLDIALFITFLERRVYD